MIDLINRPCTIIPGSSSEDDDDFGLIEPGDEEAPGEAREAVCELQQRSRREAGDGGEVSDTEWQAFFLPDETLRTGDSIEVDGERYELIGDPWKVRDPETAQDSHIEATLRRTAGSRDEA